MEDQHSIPPADLGDPDIELLLALDGQALSARVCTELLAMSASTASRRVRSLRERRLVRSVAVIDWTRVGRPVESLAKIRIDRTLAAHATALEASLRDDRHVTEAVAVLGPFDYLAHAVHPDHHAAAAWARDIRAAPGVSWCRIDRVRTRFQRPVSAVTLLKPSEQS